MKLRPITMFLLATVVGVQGSGVSALAQQSPTAPPAAPLAAPGQPLTPAEPEPVRLTVSPRGPGEPALRYSLRTDVVREKAGNAAVQWLTASNRLPAEDTDEEAKRVERWLAAPAGSLAVDEVDAYLGRKVSPGLWSQFEWAALQREADWGIPVREQGAAALLPHLSSTRRIARLIALRARLHTERREFDASVQALRLGFALADDLTAEPVLIEALVAIGIRQLMLEQIRIMQQTPDAPNLYWPLAELPTPHGLVRESMRFERALARFSLPALQRLEQGTFSREDYLTLMRELPNLGGGGGRPGGDAGASALGLGTAAVMYPTAKQFLLEHGRTPEQVDAMPAHEAVTRYMVESYAVNSDAHAKWIGLPYWQGIHGLVAAQEDFARRKAAMQVDLLSSIMLPVVNAAWASEVQSHREQAVAMTIDALRAYAAAHDGRLPASLDEMAATTPAPVDPVTGKAFDYRLEGERAVIRSPGETTSRPRAMRLEVTVRRE